MAKNDVGTCEHCGTEFLYQLIHNGFNESAYAYCGTCGMTALVDGWKMPAGICISLHGPVSGEELGNLLACSCGGDFNEDASPRCPYCRKELSASLARSYIEQNAPGTISGWQWQGSWKGLYCIVIEGKVRQDPWKINPKTG